MKTFTKTTALLAITLLATINIFASGLDFEEEQYIDDIPFNVEEIAKQARFEMAIAADFSFSDEEYIDDMPFSNDYLTKLKLYAEAISQSFSYDDEKYIDDIPFSTSALHKKPSEKFYAKALLLK